MNNVTELNEMELLRMLRFNDKIKDRTCGRIGCGGRLTEPVYTTRDEVTGNKVYESHCVNCGNIFYT